jgi:fimbrial chaperone protein
MRRVIDRDRWIRLAVILCGLALPAHTVLASSFRVTPIRVDLNSRTSSSLMTLTNDSKDELRFQISAFEWSQAEGSGEMQLTPTKDIVFFPALLTVKPAEERKVRVGTTVKSGEVEKTYRIFFEELPPLTTPETTTGSEVRIITKLGVPVFVEPTKTLVSGEIANASMAAGKLSFDLKNNGNVHFLARSVKVTALDAAGKPLVEKQREGWYVLRGGSRRYDLEFTPEECQAFKTIRISADTDMATPKPDAATLTRDFAVPDGFCRR